jgi:NAD+ diphosphatase
MEVMKSYPEAVNLPFNGEVIRDDFVPAVPGATDAGEPGFWAILQGNALVVSESGGGLSLPNGPLPEWLETKQVPLYLGLWQNRPLRAFRIGSEVKITPPYVAEPFNAVTERLDDRILTLGGLAQQILHWERLGTFCSRCGGTLVRVTASWGKKCTACSHEHFPHIHPCAIVLVRRGDEFLLVRKPEWPEGRYSLVAGFLDFGESLEECVRREVKEEAGIDVANIRYVGSQNWPFPSQLMGGFVADYAGGEIQVDTTELEDARWFTASAMPGSLPTGRSIARWIIDRFALGKL